MIHEVVVECKYCSSLVLLYSLPSVLCLSCWFFWVYTLALSSPQKALKLVTLKAQGSDEKAALLALTVSREMEMVVIVCLVLLCSCGVMAACSLVAGS